MSPAIREQITKELGVEPIMINSALVSAQNRQRLYWVGKRNPDGTYSQVPVEQPEDRGILLKDVLESGVCWREKGYALLSTTGGSTAEDMIVRRQRNGAAEEVDVKLLSEKEMDYMVRSTTKTRNHFDFGYWHDGNKDKSACLTANIHKGVPYNVLTEPVRIGTIENEAKNKDFDSQQYRVYSPEGKSVTICGQGGGVGAKTGLYAVPTGAARRGRDGGSSYEIREDQKANVITADGHQSRLVITSDDGKTYPVYEVKDGFIAIKGEQYPIKLADGYYIIRKLTVKECMRLQQVPETYEFPVSASQAYKMLGNGWSCDVIAHIMSYFDGITTEPVEVLSMYDGMSCGHIALDKLGANVTAYYATEVDQYAIKTTQHNYPDTIQLGDAFQVREEDWDMKSVFYTEGTT